MLAQQVLLSIVLVCFPKPPVEERVYFILRLVVYQSKLRQELSVETEAQGNTASWHAPYGVLTQLPFLHSTG